MYRPKLGLFLRTSLPLLAASALITACGNKDKNPTGGKNDETDDGTGGSGMGGEINQPPQPIACEEDSECDDHFYCNGEERCIDNLCRQGTPIDCDDGIDCTIDRCIEERQECESEAPDEDGDGHADGSCEDEDGNPLGDDCDDSDPLRYPGNQEICDPDNRDEDCDPTTFGNLDSDGDGFIDAACCNEDEDGELNCGDDCDDRKPNVNPAASEVCDFLDNNCDGETDEGVSIPMYEDKDHDGRGDNDADTVETCAGAVGYAPIDGDCDDEDPEVFEGQFEICDGKDNNCNGEIDEVRELAPWYKDEDGDGYGDPESTPVFSCYRIPGRVLSQNDCDDNDNTVNPNATEICDAKDNDCNGKADFKLPGNNNFEDDDGDGAADADCGGPDCNDNDPRTSEGSEEVCDGVDNDCDGEIDEQTVQNVWYIDEDGDGWGVVIGSALASCEPLVGRASKFGDCDDGDSDVKPGSLELCDGIDNDCDGLIDEGAAVHCDVPNALSMCRLGECGVFSCLPGFVDANNEPADGCETPANPADFETGIECISDTPCNDADLCNGIETCVEGFCRLGNPIACGAGPSVIQGNFTVSGGRDILDLEGIDLITGDLTITSPHLSSLIGLETLRVIGGNLYIQNNQNLVRLAGSALSNLEVVGGDIVIEGNPNLTSVALPSLVSAHSLAIRSNDALTEIQPGDFAKLANIDRLIQIESNSMLHTISGFDGIGRIGGGYDGISSACAGSGGLEIQFNPLLVTMDAFGPLAEVEGDFCIRENPVQSDLSFENLESVGMNMIFEGLPLLSNLELPILDSAGGDFVLTGGGEGGSTALEVFSLPALVVLGGALDFSGGSSLQEVALPILESANGIYFSMSNAAELANVDLSALESTAYLGIYYYTAEVGSGVPVWSFPQLTAVEQNFNVELYGEVTAVSAPLLQSVAALYVDVTSDFLETLDFSSLESTTGDLYVEAISSNNILTNVDFGSLTAIATLSVESGEALFRTPTTDLDIGQLTSVGLGNNGTITLNVAPFEVCSEIERIHADATFFGLIYTDVTCGQMTEPEL